IIFAVAIVVLAICCWPFLRIALVSEREPLTITDVVLAGSCAVIAAAVVTLAVLDALAYRQVSQHADDQLRDFADKLTSDFNHDVFRAVYVLSVIVEKPAPRLASTRGDGGGYAPDANIHDPD